MAGVANVAINVDSRGAPAKLKQVANRSKELERAVQGATAATTKVGREMKTAANGMQYFIDATGRARKANGQFVTTAEAAAAGIKKQDTAARSLIGTMTKLAATAGAGRVAAGITRTAAGFEEELRRAAAIEGGGNLDQLRQSIERVASTAAGTPTEVAALATSLSRAGFTAKETGESLQGIVTGAEATSVAFDQLGSIVSSSLRSFGLATSDTASVVDTLVQTANSSNQTILDLGEALSYAAPSARTLGISIGDLSATIGLLADNGIRGSRAGTSLSTGLNRLQLAASGSEEALFEITRGSAMLTKAMDTLGSQVLDAEGDLKPLDDVLLALKGSLDQLSVGQRVELTKALFGEEAGRGFQALLASSEEKIRSMFQTIESSQGKTEQVREEMRGFSDSMKVLGGNVENTTNAIGDKFIVVLKPLVDGLNTTLKAASELPKPIRDIGAAAAAAGIAAGGFALALKTLIPTVKLLTGLLGIGGLAGAMAALPWVALTAGVVALGVAFKDSADRAQALTDKLSSDKLAEIDSGIGQLRDRQAELNAQLERLQNSEYYRGLQADILKVKQEIDDVDQRINQATRRRRLVVEVQLMNASIPKIEGFDTLTDAQIQEALNLAGVGNTSTPTPTRTSASTAADRSGPSPEDILARQTEVGAQLLKQKEREFALVVEQDPLMKELLRISYERVDAEEQVKDAAAGQRDELLKTIQQVEQAKAGLAVGKSLAESLIGTTEQLDRVRSGFAEGIKIDEELQKANQQADLFKETMQGAGDIIGNQLRGAIDGLIDGTADWNSILQDTLKQLGGFLIKFGLNALAGSDGIGILSFLGFGTRANGGPVNANEPYIVGERGPELFMPSSSGMVLSNSDTRDKLEQQDAAMRGNEATRQQLIKQQNTMTTNRIREVERTSQAMLASPDPIDVRYESSVINNVEYVTAEQHRKGMAQAAERGRALTLQALQNSPRTRSKVGI